MPKSSYITQYNDVSLDGFIAAPGDDTSWIPDVGMGQFEKVLSDNEVILMGRRSYEFAVKENVFPYQCALNYIVTHDQDLLGKSTEEIVFSDKGPQDVLFDIEKRGFKNVFLMGGGLLNGSFLVEGLIDEIILCIHPIVLGGGTKLYEGLKKQVSLKRTFLEELSGGSMLCRYVME